MFNVTRMLVPMVALCCNDVLLAQTVTVEQGTLKGVVESNGVTAYRGIPYAQPPIGPLRWSPPAPPLHWSGTRDAAAFGPACLQAKLTDGDTARLTNPVAGLTSEDCLTLNIWVPSGTGKRLPVMVWIHGGAYRVGSSNSPFYDGSAFARDGVILVSFNYRLGLLGFFAHPALTKLPPADAPLVNYGTMDQVQALRWVRANIAAFGGDPNNVTVFGESAGGAATLLLMTVPDARGLFSKAIVESGGGWSAMSDLASAESDGEAVAKAAGLPTDASADQLRTLSPDQLVPRNVGIGFGPVIDGRMVRQTVAAAFAEGRAAEVPMIIGFNSGEDSLIDTFGMKPETLLANIPAPAQLLLRSTYGERASDDESLARRVFADGAFSAPARWIAKVQSPRAPAYLYRYDYVPEALRPYRASARHGSEIPAVFDTWQTVPGLAAALRDNDRAISRIMHSCWVSFAMTGKPSCPEAGEWTAHDADQDRLMNFGKQPGEISGFDAQAYDLLEATMLPRLTGRRPEASGRR